MSDITLDPIVSRRQSVLTHVYDSIAGNSTLRIMAGSNLMVPNHYSLYSALLKLTTDATVANRYIRMQHNVNGQEVDNILCAAITASSSGGIQMNRQSGYGSATRTVSQYLTLGELSYLISGNDNHYIYVTGGVAGDTLSIRLLYKWENWNLGLMLPKVQGGVK